MIIKNGCIIDPASGIKEEADLYIKNEKIEKVIKVSDKEGQKFLEALADQETIDASGCFVMPGLIDLHVHLRDPGFIYKEDIESGTRAAARGGVTTVCAMPNTKPVIDSVDTLNYVFDKAKKVGSIRVEQLSAMTKGQLGTEIVPIEALKDAGAIAFSEDGKSVMDINVFKDALERIGNVNGVVMSHCEDKNLVGKGVLNKGVASDKFKVPGITNSVEDVITARDIFLCHEAGVKLHLCHCSTKGAVNLIRMAKNMGFDVSGEVCPHHFTLTDADIIEEDGNYKMNPPLRTEDDVKALIEGIMDGTMEVISTDHAPHSIEEKSKGFVQSPFGIVGLETSAALTYTALVDTGLINIEDMVRLMSYNPAKIIGIDKERGSLKTGAFADVVIFDPKCEWTVSPENFASKGKNTPYAGKILKGKVKKTICGGKVVFDAADER